jgi:prepilin-type N-terminal cleavage/methylation domain-containing protein
MFRMKKRNNGNGFTLIELLIVCVILPVLSLAIYSSLSSGLRIWKRVNVPVSDEETALFFERLGVELRSAIVLKDAGFQGFDYKFEFPCVVPSARMRKRTVGRIAYVFDPSTASIGRSAVDYSGMFTGSTPVPVPVVGHVQQSKFSFYRYDPDEKRFVWVDNWVFPGLPLAVRVELQRESGGEPDTIVRTFSLPASRKTYE